MVFKEREGIINLASLQAKEENKLKNMEANLKYQTKFGLETANLITWGYTILVNKLVIFWHVNTEVMNKAYTTSLSQYNCRL